MENFNLFSSHRGNSTGWKRAAKINCIILVCMSIILMGLLIAAACYNDSFQGALFLYNGTCDGGSVSQINTALHLLINVFSTLVLASSNFFMQVLNSPSREEINAAHLKSSWLEIGVPSIQNIPHVSKFKTWCWTVLLLSSIPIHLLFNSAIFEMDHRESTFSLTIASEEFSKGGSYYPIGASLLLPGNNSSNLNFQALEQYSKETSNIVQNISAIAMNAHGWERLQTIECQQEYLSCSGLRQHRNVVVVADQPGGWIRDQMWQLNGKQTELWDKYVTPNGPNHLFFYDQCKMSAAKYEPGSISCLNSCKTYFPPEVDLNGLVDISNWGYTFDHDLDISNEYYGDLKPTAFQLKNVYCLAEPLDGKCYVALLPTLLMGVTLCVIAKTCTAIIVTVVLIRRDQTPLVTLGDAIASFIENSDPVTAGLCTLGQSDVRRLLADKDNHLISGAWQWRPSRRPRATVIPTSVWLMSYLIFALSILICGVCLGMAHLTGVHFAGGSFLQSDQNPFIQGPFTLFGGIITTNSPQLLLSLYYLAYNSLYTRLQTAREWAVFLEEYRPLRVTDPKGEQHATYWLQLPYKYSIPLIIVSIGLHWLLSDAIYLFVSIGGYYEELTRGAQPDPSLPPNTTVNVGFSIYALWTMMVVLCVLAVFPIHLSLELLPLHMVNIGNNSFALSAACHASRLSNATEPPRRTSTRNPTLSMRLSNLLKLKNRSTEGPYDAIGETSLETGFSDIEMQDLVALPQPLSRPMSSRPSQASDRHIIDQAEEDINEVAEQTLFRNLARSKIRWGVVRMHPEWCAEFGHESVVGHFSFGIRGDNVQKPIPGRLYA
ncbi:hypothetical protein F4818DRAFT_413614 [Hypoxylon cercidicola]|nr:hypothetical protein F4818DRAFT_413614 [Hypoxylon cercidicola]